MENNISTSKIPLSCGIVMPISPLENYTAEHWKEVQQIIKDSVKSAGFEPSMVSDADDVGIIQKRIIQNLYSNPIVVCDVSGKNPNVMFELGMRLAFDKPTIIIKDDITSYSFDTSPIEYLEYPRDLRYQKNNDFKEKLKDKISGTFKKASSDSNYSTFLHEFGQFKVAHIQEKEVSTEQYLLQAFDELRTEMKQLVARSFRHRDELINFKMNSLEEHKIIDDFYKRAMEQRNVPYDDTLNKIEVAELIKKDLRENGFQIPITSIISYLENK